MSTDTVQAAREPLRDDALVRLMLTGRPQVLTMAWAIACDRFLSHFGDQAIEDCRGALERGNSWVGKGVGESSTISLTVEREPAR